MMRFHLSLNVSDIPKAVSFLERVLGTKVSKQRADYAKFELDSPPLVLSLEQKHPGAHGSLNHLGFRAPDSATLVEMQRRLEQAGIFTQREEEVECCYAKQTKFWVHDLDYRLWEFYTLDDDHLDHRGAGQSLQEMVGEPAAMAVSQHRDPIIWEHRMYQPFIPVPHCDEVRLRGTFNVPVTDEEMQSQLDQAYQSLKPGGQVMVHTLTAEGPISGELNLPGPAAYVKHVPIRTRMLEAMERAGFVDLRLTTFRSGACFEHQGVSLRETQVVAFKPTEESTETCTVVFKGPFQSVGDDEGTVWRRGEPTVISKSRWESLQQSPTAEMFVLLPQTAEVGQCGV